MSFIELFLIGVGLSMDAFAAAICQGLFMTRIKWGHALTVGLYFGGFQALMPFTGWMLGSQFADRIQQYDHWIAFILLVLIGGNMIREALSGDEEDAAQAVGCWFGARYKKRAEITGGAILVLLGIKLLLEHLGILAF